MDRKEYAAESSSNKQMTSSALEVNEEQMVYCEDVYEEEHEDIVQQDVPCYVMNNSFQSPANLSAANRDHTTCHFCGEDLTNKRFYNHLFDQHGFTKQQCEMLKQQKRLEATRMRRAMQRGRHGGKMEKLHACSVCGMEYITRNGLISHLSRSISCSRDDEVDETKSSITNIVCPSYGCDKNVSTYLDLAIHVDSDHRDMTTIPDCFRIRRVTFQDKQSFANWKKNMEKETGSEFFLRTSQKVSFAIRTFLFKCVYSNSRGHMKGRRCEQCPAFIKCCERNHGQFEVVACFGHIGHEHHTETALARDMRVEKYRQIDSMEARNLAQHTAQLIPSSQKRHILVDEYGQEVQQQEEVVYLEDVPEVVLEEVYPDDDGKQQQVVEEEVVIQKTSRPRFIHQLPGSSGASFHCQ